MLKEANERRQFHVSLSLACVLSLSFFCSITSIYQHFPLSLPFWHVHDIQGLITLATSAIIINFTSSTMKSMRLVHLLSSNTSIGNVYFNSIHYSIFKRKAPQNPESKAVVCVLCNMMTNVVYRLSGCSINFRRVTNKNTFFFNSHRLC